MNLAGAMAGCVINGPTLSKSDMGNLEINVSAPKDFDVGQTRLYLDGVYIGNVSHKMPILHAKRGRRTVRAELDGCKTYESEVFILGEPNHQVLNIVLRPK